MSLIPKFHANRFTVKKFGGKTAANLRWERFKQTCRNRSVVGAGRETTFCYHSELRSERVKLENYPQFLTLLLLGGLQHPVVAAVAGTTWCLGRIAYARGYYSGDPSKRMQGGFGYFGLFTLIGLTVKLGINTLGWM
ncbi:hypothetical protein J6590_035356 [Homalodisca vitripennis]|nr:hypothetical protein J6590_035356 [Homalodisca vitripennis]